MTGGNMLVGHDDDDDEGGDDDDDDEYIAQDLLHMCNSSSQRNQDV